MNARATVGKDNREGSLDQTSHYIYMNMGITNIGERTYRCHKKREKHKKHKKGNTKLNNMPR